MENLTQPTLLLKPFAENGQRNSIPENATGTNQASLDEGFPPVTAQNPRDGGIPPVRLDFNGLGHLTTTYDYFYQAGGTFTFNQTICDAIGGYPLGARLWYTPSDGVSIILRSTKPNNTDNFLQDQSFIGTSWVKDTPTMSDIPVSILEFKWSDHIINDTSWVRADTFSWQDGELYTTAYEHLVDDFDGTTSTTETIGSYTITYYLAEDGHKIVLPAMEATVQNIYNATGVAWYYILDTGNKRFKLPRTKWGFTGLRDTVGNYIQAGLPNITGSVGGVDRVDGGQSGAFAADGAAGSGGTSSNNWANITFNASRSNSIYGKSTTVQPPATQMYLYFYIGNYTKSAVEQTAGLNSELFNGKLDLDVGNATQTTKETMVGWGIPDYSAGVTYSSDFVAPSNGYMFCRNQIGAWGIAKLLADGDFIDACHNPTSAGTILVFTRGFCKKGQTISKDGVSGWGDVIFYPLIGG